MFRSLKEFRLELLSLLLLVIGAYFAFPLKQGVKADAAVYIGMARNIVETGVWWPLGLMNDLFPKFYEHPPGLMWMQAFAMKLFQSPSIEAGRAVSAFFSLLSIFLTFFAAKEYFRRDKVELKSSIRGAAWTVFFLVSWSQWLKFSRDPQLEAPTAFAIILLFTSLAGYLPKRLKLLASFIAGFLGFITKGLFFAPVILGLVLLTPFKRHLIKPVGVFLIGYLASVGLVSYIDFSHGTGFNAHYWGRLISWLLGGQAGAPSSLGFDTVLDLLGRVWIFLKTEANMSFLWSPLFGFILLWWTYKNFKRLKSIPDEIAIALAMFLPTISAISLMKIKMPHWPVPLYPLAAFLLVAMLPRGFLSSKFTNFFWSRLIPGFTLIAYFIFAFVPYPVVSRWGRGEEWNFLKEQIPDHASYNYHIVQDNLPMYMVFTYTHWFLGRETQKTWVSKDRVVPCSKRSDLLVTKRGLLKNHKKLASLGWEPSLIKPPRLDLYKCVKK